MRITRASERADTLTRTSSDQQSLAVEADLCAAVDRLLLSVEDDLDSWDLELSQVLPGPQWTPLLRQRLAALRTTAARCRELSDAMLANASSRTPDAATSRRSARPNPLSSGGGAS